MTKEQRERFEKILEKTPHYEEEAHNIIRAMKAAYNLAIEDAADKAQTKSEYLPSKDDVQFTVDRDSILKLKIE